MEPDPKDELARVRAREQLYKSNAEARIADSHSQLEALQGEESRAAATTAELEKLKRDHRELGEQKTALENQAVSLQAQLETMKDADARALACASELKTFRSAQGKLEKENARLKQRTTDQKELKSRCGALEKENTSLRNRMGALEEELTALKAAAAQNEASASELKKLKTALTQLQNENTTLTNYNQELEIKFILLFTYISQVGAKNLAKAFVWSSKAGWIAPFLKQLADLGYSGNMKAVIKELKTVDYEHSILEVLDKLCGMFVPIKQEKKQGRRT